MVASSRDRVEDSLLFARHDAHGDRPCIAHCRYEYQRALNEENVKYAKAATGLVTDYPWKLDSPAKSAAAAKSSDVPPADVLMGLDVWARGDNEYPGDYKPGLENSNKALNAIRDAGLWAADQCRKRQRARQTDRQRSPRGGIH